MIRTALALLVFFAALTPRAFAETFAERWDRKVREFQAENPRLKASQDIVLFGSSSTEGWKYSRRVERYLPKIGGRVVNRGISGDGVGLWRRGLLNRVDVSVLQAKPKFVFILNGRNSIGQRDGVARSAEVYERVVRTIQAADSKGVVTIISCAPVRGRYAHLKTKIVEFNARLRRIARRTGARFIDLHARLTDDDGLMKASLTSDGLHFKNAGYRILGQLMEATIAAAPTPSSGSDPSRGESSPGAARSVERFLEAGERALAGEGLSWTERLRLRRELWSRRLNPDRCFRYETVDAFLGRNQSAKPVRREVAAGAASVLAGGS